MCVAAPNDAGANDGRFRIPLDQLQVEHKRNVTAEKAIHDAMADERLYKLATVKANGRTVISLCFLSPWSGSVTVIEVGQSIVIETGCVLDIQAFDLTGNGRDEIILMTRASGSGVLSESKEIIHLDQDNLPEDYFAFRVSGYETEPVDGGETDINYFGRLEFTALADDGAGRRLIYQLQTIKKVKPYSGEPLVIADRLECELIWTKKVERGGWSGCDE